MAEVIPKLVKSWGEGRFPSQGDMAKWIEGKFDHLEADLSGDMRGLKAEIQELLKNANKTMSQRMDQRVAECVENKVTPVENKLTSMEMMLRRTMKSSLHCADRYHTVPLVSQLSLHKGTCSRGRRPWKKRLVPFSPLRKKFISRLRRT